jgi:hypothetical protein
MNNKEDELTHIESIELEQFLLPNVVDNIVEIEQPLQNPIDKAINNVNKNKKQRTPTEKKASKYMDLKFVIPDSNLCERLFSRAKIILSERRKAIVPYHLEALLFLKYNKKLWDENTIAKVHCRQKKLNIAEQVLLGEEIIDDIEIFNENINIDESEEEIEEEIDSNINNFIAPLDETVNNDQIE